VAALPRPLSEREIAMLSALDRLVDTPRKAKRLFNLYRMMRATRDLSESSRFLGDDEEPGEYQAVAVLLGLVTAHGRLLGALLDTAPQAGADVRGGLVQRAAGTRWTSFVADLEPRRSGDGWSNGVAGVLREHEVREWAAVHHGLSEALTEVTLYDLSCFQRWAPRVRRFSYVLDRA
jgi:hypothetical protein